MKILAISDEESPSFWEYYTPGKLKPYDLIISCGDLKADYLSFLVTVARCPLLYVHGNHDEHYVQKPPEGCDCIDDKLVVYNGLRILGLGGCRRYRNGEFQYTERQMRRRIRKLRFLLWRNHGVDIVVTHAPAAGLGDTDDPAHWGFECLKKFLDKYHPTYMLHGHVHLNYTLNHPRIIEYNGTTIINATEHYVLDVDEPPHPQRSHNVLKWKNGAPKVEREQLDY